MNLAEIQDEIERYINKREGVGKSIAQIQAEIVEFVKAREEREESEFGRRCQIARGVRYHHHSDQMKDRYYVPKYPRRN